VHARCAEAARGTHGRIPATFGLLSRAIHTLRTRLRERTLAGQLVDIAFKYDNVVMEESAQILEVETFIPLLLQNPDDGYNRLKRVILIGDHNQLPPVVKNMAFQRYGNMEQSLFARFIRLGVPHVLLDAQGRCRPSLANLFAWKYPGLGNLPTVTTNPAYKAANTGFAHDFQVWHREEEKKHVPFPYRMRPDARKSLL